MQQRSASDLPASMGHTFLQEGLHRIVFALSAAGEPIDSVEAPITVDRNAAANGSALKPGTVLGSERFNASGEFPLGANAGGVGECGSPDAEETFPWTFNSSFNGTPAEVSRVLLNLDSSGTVQDADLFLLDGNGTEVAAATDGGPDKTLDVPGPFSAGTYTVKVAGCTAVDGSFVLDGEATYVAADVDRADAMPT